MKFVTHQHRFGLDIIHSDERLASLWSDIETTLNGLTDQRIIDEYNLSENAMSISTAIKNLIDTDLKQLGMVDLRDLSIHGAMFKRQKL